MNRLSRTVILCLAVSLPGAWLPAQQNNTQQAPPQQASIEHLRRDQDEILRKGERLQALMQRLLVRYQQEGKQQQVELLQQGLEHLLQSGVLQDFAGIRDDLVASAWSDALRKQQETVAELEKLLDILLERKSIENLDADLKKTSELARTARQLEQKQRDLQQETRQASQREPSAGEQQLLQQLQQLQKDQQAEALQNQRQAGNRRPTLEEALQRVERLLQQQGQLEQRTDRELSGAVDPSRQQQFDVGELIQRTRELQQAVRDQDSQQRLQQASKQLQEALQAGDRNAVQQQKDKLQAEAQAAPTLQDQEGAHQDKEWQQLADALQKAGSGDTEAERRQLQQLADDAAALAQKRAAAQQQQNQQAAQQLDKDSAALAERLADGKTPPADSPAEAVQQANQQLAKAGATEQPADTKAMQQRLTAAQKELEEARRRLQQQNPDASQLAGSMAADAKATEQQLQNSPAAGAEEQKAAQALDQAEGALRQAEQSIEAAKAGTTPKATPEQQLQQSRQSLEQAKAQLQQGLQQAAQDRSPDMQAGADRQQELQQQASALQQQMQQQAQQGGITPEQQQGGERAMQKAQQAMQKAQQQLQSQQQASAAESQQQAADALQQAQQELRQNRPMDEQQKQQMQQLAEQQKQLEEDILELAKEIKERQNKAAERALDQAAEAARKAQQSMRDSEPEDTDQQQEEAKKQLQKAAEQLEEERDRYQDLRQEELMFRMMEELKNFLQRQEPVTKATLEAQEALQRDNALSRPARLKLNRLGEEEQELAGKVQAVTAALSEEGNLVFVTVLKANDEDLHEVARRLAGRAPDPGSYTTMLQQDVERRTRDLIAALERERQRKEQERKDQQDQQDPQQSKNRFSPQRQKLVSLIADLQMLKQLELDTRRGGEELKLLTDLRGDAGISDAEVALIERLSHRHGEVTTLFQQIKAQMEQALQQQEQQDGGDGNDDKNHDGKRGK